ncbi:hypothetical protein JXB31_04805 [Candidatus Woesearchaeota archaeon]|nr:hypothetical protein [Candidatus Woesearchaeota archaeon]
MKKLLSIGMFLLCICPVLGIVNGDSDADGIPDFAETESLSCDVACPTGYHCEIPAGTVIYKTENNYSGNFGNRASADDICLIEKPAELNIENVHALVSFREKTNPDLQEDKQKSDFILYMPKRYGYDDFQPMYWYNRETTELTMFAGNWNDALNGNIITPNYVGTGDDTPYWTGSDSRGKYYWFEEDNRTCKGWTYSIESLSGTIGDPTAKNRRWFSSSTEDCSQKLKILCAAELTAGSSAGFCVENCTPTKTECEPGDCGLHSDGCGGKILCNSSCPTGSRCRSPNNSPFAFNMQCTNCQVCNVGRININPNADDSGTFGTCRNVEWNCNGYDDCSDWTFIGFADGNLCAGDPGSNTCEYSIGTDEHGNQMHIPNENFDIDSYADTLVPKGCIDQYGNFGDCVGKDVLKDGETMPSLPYTPEEKSRFYSCSCFMSKGCGGFNGKCDAFGCPITQETCVPDRPVEYWVGCGYGCCTLKSGYTGRKCPSYMNPGGDPGYHDTG